VHVGAALSDQADRHDLTLAEFFVCNVMVDGHAVATNDPDPELRRRALNRFRGLCQCAAEAGFESIMGLPGMPQPELSDDDAWEIAVEMLAAMVAAGAEYGVQVDVEPHVGSIAQTPEKARELAEAVPGLRYTLDYAHFVGQRIAQEEVRVLHPFVGHFHAKPARPGYPKCLAHRNAIDFAAILDDLKSRAWEGVMAVECIGRWDDAIGRPIYQEISADDGPLPVTPDLLHHPVAQTMRLGYHVARHLSQANT
jgi:sugar phosphate isomerase/epimerase